MWPQRSFWSTAGATPAFVVFESPGLLDPAALTHMNKHICKLSAGDMCSRSNFSMSHPVWLFFTDLLLLGGKLAPLVAQHPRYLGEGHVWSLSPKLFPPVVHKADVACEGGFGGVAVLHWLLPLPPLGPAATPGLLNKWQKCPIRKLQDLIQKN